MVKKAKAPIVYATVPKIWPGETVVCIASGPSLTPADVDACRGRARVIVVNDGYRLAPWADVLYACDAAWWRAHGDKVVACGFAGMKYTLTPDRRFCPDVQVLENRGDGLDLHPSALGTGATHGVGGNSGYQAINLAVHFGAARIVLLGYDMQRTGRKSHWFGEHSNWQRPPLVEFRPAYGPLPGLLQSIGVSIVNCSRETALTTIPRQPLAAALQQAVAA